MGIEYIYISIWVGAVSSFELQIGNPKRRYKDLENRRHAGLGQEAAPASIRTGGTRTSKNAETRGSQKQEASGLRTTTREHGPWKLRGFEERRTLPSPRLSCRIRRPKQRARHVACVATQQCNRGWNYIWRNSEQNLNGVYYRICLERGWVFHLPNLVNPQTCNRVIE